MYVQSAVQFHAHKCMACEKSGKDVTWIHPNTCAGNVQAHRCPECGEVQWKQCKVESAKLPQMQQQNHAHQIDLYSILVWILLLGTLAFLAYSAYGIIQEKRGKKIV